MLFESAKRSGAELRKTLGAFTLTMLGVGSIIGAGCALLRVSASVCLSDPRACITHARWSAVSEGRTGGAGTGVRNLRSTRAHTTAHTRGTHSRHTTHATAARAPRVHAHAHSIFVVTGVVAKENTGPAVIISFLVAGITALLSAFVYSEARVCVCVCVYVYV